MPRKARKSSKIDDEMNDSGTFSTSSTEGQAVKKKKSSSPARKRTKKANDGCKLEESDDVNIIDEPMKLMETFVKTFQMEELQEITEKEGAAFWKSRYDELFNLRMTEPEELQKAAMTINEEERELTRKKEQAQQKKIQELENTNKDLRLEISQLTAAKVAAQEVQINEGIKKLQAVNDELINDKKLLKADNDKLTDERKTLKAMVKKLNAEKSCSTAQITQNAVDQSNLAEKLTQFTSILDIYQILTTLSISLSMNDNCDEKATEESERYVDVICTASNAKNAKKKIVFELSVSSSVKDQVDCLPRPDLSTVDKFPTFLEEEISFDRKMAPMFLKAVLDSINAPSS